MWIADGSGGRLLRVDPESKNVTVTEELDPTRSSIAIGKDAVWVISSADDAGGALRKIDPVTGHALGQPLELRGWPTDIAAAGRSLWLSNYTRDSFIEIKLDPASDTGAEPAASPTDVLFYYSAGGDIWARDAGGESKPVVATPESEVRPSLSSNLTKLAYQRGEEGASEVVVRSERDEAVIGPGTWPSFSPDDRLAYFAAGGADGVSKILILERDGSQTALKMLPGKYRHLVWDAAGDTVYYEALGTIGQHFVDEAVAPFHIAPEEEGASYAAPTNADDDSIDVLKLCCGPAPERTEIEIGRISFSEGGPRYKTLLPLDPDQIDPTSGELFLAGWTNSSRSSSWMISDGLALRFFSYHASGEASTMPVETGGAAIDGIATAGALEPREGSVRFEL